MGAMTGVGHPWTPAFRPLDSSCRIAGALRSCRGWASLTSCWKVECCLFNLWRGGYEKESSIWRAPDSNGVVSDDYVLPFRAQRRDAVYVPESLLAEVLLLRKSCGEGIPTLTMFSSMQIVQLPLHGRMCCRVSNCFSEAGSKLRV